MRIIAVITIKAGGIMWTGDFIIIPRQISRRLPVMLYSCHACGPTRLLIMRMVFDIREAGPVWIEICDMQGIVVASRLLNGNKEVPVNHLHEGLYLYIINGKNRISGRS